MNMPVTAVDILLCIAALGAIIGLAAFIRRALGDLPLLGPGCGGG